MTNQIEKNSSDGVVFCNKNNILSIISLATKEITGVASMDDRFTSRIKDKLSSNYYNGAKIKFVADNKIVVDVYINVYQNYNVPEVTYKIQQNIKNSIGTMVNLSIEKINVHVVGVVFNDGEESQN